MAQSREEKLEQVEAAKRQVAEQLATSLYGALPPEPAPVGAAFGGDPFGALVAAGDVELLSPDANARRAAMARLEAKVETDRAIAAKVATDAKRRKAAPEPEPAAWDPVQFEHDMSLLQGELADEDVPLADLLVESDIDWTS